MDAFPVEASHLWGKGEVGGDRLVFARLIRLSSIVKNA